MVRRRRRAAARTSAGPALSTRPLFPIATGRAPGARRRRGAAGGRLSAPLPAGRDPAAVQRLLDPPAPRPVTRATGAALWVRVVTAGAAGHGLWPPWFLGAPWRGRSAAPRAVPALTTVAAPPAAVLTLRAMSDETRPRRCERDGWPHARADLRRVKSVNTRETPKQQRDQQHCRPPVEVLPTRPWSFLDPPWDGSVPSCARMAAPLAAGASLGPPPSEGGPFRLR